MRVERSNTDGKYEIQLLREGPGQPSFSKRYPPSRVLRIDCEARVQGGEHTLRFLAKDEKGDEWLANEKRTIKPDEWVRLEVRLWVDSTKDFLFRIDDQNVTHAPSCVLIRGLTVVEENL